MNELWLIVRRATDERVMAMTGDRVSFGRDLSCDVVLDDAKASRLHAEITRDSEGRLVLTDLASHNGTVVGGSRLVGSCVLQPGETFRLGRTEIEVHTTAPEVHPR